ncbi:MAG: 50S ribosomal protein L11 methyltransferase [Ginsengibacter sp.]
MLTNHSTISIHLNPVTDEQSDILIAQLSDIGFYAFEEVPGVLIAYIMEVDFDENQLKKFLPNLVSYSIETIADQNWNSKWESEFQPVIVNDFAAVRANFHEAVKHVKHDLIITPKMSFGTGHHATTFMMIQLMEIIDFKGRRVLDYGTGTGVLAILAEKLGAQDIVAIDMDEWSINNTIENVEANHCQNIHVEQKNNLCGLGEVDIILANINLNILTGSCEAMSSIVRNGGLVLTSGFLKTDEEKMAEIFSKHGFIVKNKLGKEIWMSILFEKH